MTINLQKPDITELKPRITVFGIGGGGGNAVNNMINAGLQGVDFVVANTDAQALTMTKAERYIQLGANITQGLGAGASPEVGAEAAKECLDYIIDQISNSHMLFITAGMGGGTGTGAAPVIANAARERGILTVGVVTKPFNFEGARRMKTAEKGIIELQKNVDTLIVIPNQNLFHIANDKTTFAEAFSMADQVLYSGVASVTDLMVKEGMINLDFADVRSVMHEMGRAMMGTGEATGENRALAAAEAAIANPLLDETSMRGARGLLISITGGRDLTLFEVDAAATRIRDEVDMDANVIFGAIHDDSLDGCLRVSVVATGIDRPQLDLDKNSLDFDQNLDVSLDSQSTSHVEQTAKETPKAFAIDHVKNSLAQETPLKADFVPKSQLFEKQPADLLVKKETMSFKEQSDEPVVLANEALPDLFEDIKQDFTVVESKIVFAEKVIDPTIAAKAEQTAFIFGNEEEKEHQFSSIIAEKSSETTLGQDDIFYQNADFFAEKKAHLQAEISTNFSQKASLPPLEDFPKMAQKNYLAHKQETKAKVKGVRRLWDTLKNSFSSEESDKTKFARLEPDITPQIEKFDQNDQTFFHKKKGADSLYAPNVKDGPQKLVAKKDEGYGEENFEIPEFLRRQVN